MTAHLDPSGNQTRSLYAFEALTSEMDKETAEGSHLHSYRSQTHEMVAMGHKAGRQPLLPMCGNSECSSSYKMLAGGRWEGKESRASRGRQRVVPGGS